MSALIVSPSRIKDAARCLRYWAFHKIARLPREETQPLRDGKAAHSVAENYLKHGTQPSIQTKHGRWFVEGMHLLPKPRTCLVEHRVQFAWSGLQWTVVTDFIHLQSRTKGDHKFIGPGSFPFTLTPETMLDDCQVLLNVIAPPQFPETNLRWIYYPKSGGRKTWAVDSRIAIAAAEENFKRLHLPLVQQMHEYHKLCAGAHPDDMVALVNCMPCNAKNCFAYGKPCEYMAQCGR